MQTQTILYSGATKTWNVDAFPDLDSSETLVLLFGSSSFFDSYEAIQELINNYPTSHIMGCSTSGEIHNRQISDNSISVAITRFDKTNLRSISIPISKDTTQAASEQIIAQLSAPNLRGIFFLGSGLDVNFASVIRDLQQKLGKEVIITGGISGDDDRFERTWVLHKGKPTEDMITVVGFYGSHIHIGYGSQGGWEPSGIPMLITKSEDNILYELNGWPALSWYKQQLRKYDVQLPAAALFFPLAIRPSLSKSDYLVRTILGIDEEERSMIFAGEINQRYFAQFMTSTHEQLVQGAQNAAYSIQANDSSKTDQLAIAVSCVGRRLVMEDKTDNELNAVLDILPENTKQVGFYSYGEICPSTRTGFSALHNQTMTLTLLSESL